MMLMLFGLIVAACGGEGTTTSTEQAAAETSTTEEVVDETTTTEEIMDDDVLAVAEAEGDLGTFLAATEAAGIMEDFHGEGPFTLFIPTDEAFAAYLDSAGMSQEEAFAGAEMLQSILGQHIVTEHEDSEMVMGMDGQSFPTMSGGELLVTVDGETVMVGDATILRYDIPASNGIIHVIDTVLAPPEG
jgi:uncharacterized surface protein with fasciclin (FAS1) repeats